MKERIEFSRALFPSSPPAVVAWTVNTLTSAERPETHWYGGDAGAMLFAAQELSLDKGWQRRVLAAVGNYGDIFERHLGKGSPLKLDYGSTQTSSKKGCS